MMKALTFGAGLAVGYVFGTKAGRQRYEQLKSQVGKFWQDPRTQEKISGAKETVKHTVTDSVGNVVPGIKERLHTGGQKAEAGPGTVSDPARRDTVGNDWTDEGGATSAGPATNTDPTRDQRGF
ncbi:YtxH domain-containing protein [Arthrobacter mobilis]|uniref:YtxH domain-containing protein n=1 Tax=Arthrobacter mobilis TaxID=2724944 RepID=A0A7X6HCD9_9MICC|nr:YtxH domain-containing protein [Arthrobacter mobilis]NKX53331.1 YtxH domain-containing protein [Arthrobacter mobilis]